MGVRPIFERPCGQLPRSGLSPTASTPDHSKGKGCESHQGASPGLSWSYVQAVQAAGSPDARAASSRRQNADGVDGEAARRCCGRRFRARARAGLHSGGGNAVRRCVGARAGGLPRGERGRAKHLIPILGAPSAERTFRRSRLAVPTTDSHGRANTIADPDRARCGRFARRAAAARSASQSAPAGGRS
jgi:hypothetical protein